MSEFASGAKTVRWSVIACLFAVAAAASGQSTEYDSLELIGTEPTTGAAPGYLDDSVCARCHQELYDSYQSVGMAQSLRIPQASTPIEAFGRVYSHDPSRRSYRIDRADDGSLTFLRYQATPDGQEINRVEIPIDWVLGSGNRARSYLYRNASGEVFMLPVSWYSEPGAWRMSPGFESATHEGLGRQVTRACLFCHNAYPEVEVDSDHALAAQRFPETLPQGIGCQRCHGPGASHVAAVLEGKDQAAIHAAIVNPARLAAPERDSVCFQCHLLPAEAVEGVRRLGRGDYSFRPGQLLADYMVNVEAVDGGEGRFEINHHGYRLMQSSCYRESAGQLGCITCHDPHVKASGRTFRDNVAGQCTGCHADAPDAHSLVQNYRETECVDCHMPTRRTDDVIEVTMTDHRISRGPFDTDSLIREKDPGGHAIDGIRLLDPGALPEGDEAALYRSLALLKSGRLTRRARDVLRDVQSRGGLTSPYAVLELAKAELTTGDPASAEEHLRRVLSDGAQYGAIYSLLGTTMLAQQRPTSAIAALSRAVELEPDAEAYFNLAAAQLSAGHVDDAAEAIERALELRPTLGIAWRYRGLILEARGNNAAAIAALENALRIDPGDGAVYADLVRLHAASGNTQDASRIRAHGLAVARDPGLLQ